MTLSREDLERTLRTILAPLTDDMIGEGNRQECMTCPTALACNESLPKLHAYVALARTYLFPSIPNWHDGIDLGTAAVQLHHGPRLRQWIADYDGFGRVSPATLAIDLAVGTMELISDEDNDG